MLKDVCVLRVLRFLSLSRGIATDFSFSLPLLASLQMTCEISSRLNFPSVPTRKWLALKWSPRIAYFHFKTTVAGHPDLVITRFYRALNLTTSLAALLLLLLKFPKIRDGIRDA